MGKNLQQTYADLNIGNTAHLCCCLGLPLSPHVGSLWVLSLVRFIGKSKLPLGVSAYGCLSLSVLAQQQTVQGVP